MEEFELQFGNLAVQKGFITIDQLTATRNRQMMDTITGKERKPLGILLFEEGLLSIPKVKELFRSMVAA
jgi:hypothetical protein